MEDGPKSVAPFSPDPLKSETGGSRGSVSHPPYQQPLAGVKRSHGSHHALTGT